MIKLEWQGDGLKLLQKATEALGSEAKAKKAYAMALNKTVVTVNREVKRTLSKQMGVSQANLVKHGKLTIRRAAAGNLAAVIDARGGYLPLKDFRPSQNRKGVRHGAWGSRSLNEGAFLNKGRRAVVGQGPVQRAKAGGHVFKNTGLLNEASGRHNAIAVEWGPSVPNEMVKGQSEQAFYRIAGERMPIEVDRAIKALAGKIL